MPVITFNYNYPTTWREAVTLKRGPDDDSQIPPTYLHCLKNNLEKKGRGNINERDRRLVQYIRLLQESKRRTWPPGPRI